MAIFLPTYTYLLTCEFLHTNCVLSVLFVVLICGAFRAVAKLESHGCTLCFLGGITLRAGEQGTFVAGKSSSGIQQEQQQRGGATVRSVAI